MSASTMRSSPTIRLIGERPQSISGCTLSITTNGNPLAMRLQSIEIHPERKDKSDCSAMPQWLRGEGGALSGNPRLWCELNYAEKQNAHSYRPELRVTSRRTHVPNTASNMSCSNRPTMG